MLYAVCRIETEAAGRRHEAFPTGPITQHRSTLGRVPQTLKRCVVGVAVGLQVGVAC